MVGSSSRENKQENNLTNSCEAPAKLSMESLQRTISDISLELMMTKELASNMEGTDKDDDDHHKNNKDLPAITEEEELAKCECCGMAEECTADYISRLRRKYSGKLVCGICAEAVNEEMEKKGVTREEALKEHMSACSRFNKLGRTHPLLYQAEAVKQILKKSSISGRARSLSPRDYKGINSSQRKSAGVLARSSSCIPTLGMISLLRGHADGRLSAVSAGFSLLFCVVSVVVDVAHGKGGQ
ncbi:hypothetical protein G4B88_021158 [Cannabis sativa]|uniref:Uncharacterized protein n=1 Tax=Cannabis sativa TaxID=3483 RepID=A0A7J6HXC6_CANSA|nr:hypothetical protein G4B88_021158 [Cannabis sativa]